MIRDAAGDFGSHQRFDLEPLLKLPDGAEGEIDIEGLDVDGGYLWLIGSHSLKRKKPDEDDDPEDNIDCLSEVEADGNRFTLGRVPFTNGPDLQPVSEQWWLDRGTPGRERARQSADEVVEGRSSHRAVRSPFLEWQDGRNSRARTTGSTSRGWPFPEIGPSWVYEGRSSGAGPWSSSFRWLTFRAACSGWRLWAARRPLPKALLATGGSWRS